MSNYILSIIIPTFNGAEWIEDTLESVLTQAIDFKDSVEILVRDNASSDDLESLIKKLNVKYHNIIRYDKRETNVIADINFRESINLAVGEYILLLGDDDLLFPNFIKQTLSFIQSNPGVGLVYYNRICTTRDYHGASLKHKNPNSTFYRMYDNVTQFVADHISGPDFMSVNVVRKECILKGFSFAKSQYYGVEWYSSILYGLYGYKCISCFVPMILQRVPLKRFWDDRALLYLVIGIDNMFKDLNSLYPGIHEIWNDYSKKEISRFAYLTTCIPLNRKLYKEKFNELKQKLNCIQRFVALTLIKCPMSYCLFRGVYILNKIFNKITRVFSFMF